MFTIWAFKIITTGMQFFNTVQDSFMIDFIFILFS